MALAWGSLAPAARADGDPASDYLQANQVFLASESPAASSNRAEAPVASPAQVQLLSVVRAANRAGFAIRVAIVGSEYDLGSITELWRKPALYARFLGLELSSVYRGRLLVVMPNGLGFSWPGHSTGPGYRELARVPVVASGGSLPGLAQTAVRDLAAVAGVRLAPSSGRPRGSHGSGGGASWLLIAGVMLVLVLVVGLVFVVRGPRTTVRLPRASAGRRDASGRPRWALPGFAAVCLAAFAVPVGALLASRHSSDAAGTSTAAVLTPPPVSWPSGVRPAHDFALRDQDGRRVSISAYRGRPVIVTFVDPLCRNLCPLEAHVLNAAVGQVPSAKRPAILAVSVDVYANRRADLLQDVRKWSLVPQWHWAVGDRAALTAVWRHYQVGVSVVTKKIAGKTINYITHTEAAYLIDSSGHERALFVWPFYPQDVVRTLRQLG